MLLEYEASRRYLFTASMSPEAVSRATFSSNDSKHSRPGNFIHSKLKQKMNIKRTPSDLETLWHSHIPHLCCCFCRHLGWCHLHCLCCSSRLCCLHSCCCLHCLGGMHSSLGRGLGGLCGCCLKWVKGKLNCPYSALCSFTCMRWPLGFLVFSFLQPLYTINSNAWV